MSDGQILMLQDLYPYKLPPVPPETQILFHNYKKENQFWRRLQKPVEDINKMRKADQFKFRDKEDKRCQEGIWIMNNGEPIYFTGHYYNYLTWYPIIDVGYPQHRRYQREFFYFVDYNEKDVFCAGEAVSKIRKAGITGIYVSIDFNLLRYNREKRIHVQSKVNKNAYDFNYKPFQYALDRLPEVMKPMTRKNDTKAIVFGTPRLRWTGSKKNKEAIAEMNKLVSLENTYEYIPTVAAYDDGDTLFRGRRDEIAKFPSSQSAKESLQISIPVVRKGNKIIGKLAYYTTNPARDTQNMKEWTKIYFDSDPKKRTKAGTTVSLLHKWFISGLVALEGTDYEDLEVDLTGVEFFDKYGECNEKLAWETIKGFRQPYIDDGDYQGLQGIIRQFPINEEEAFGTSGTDTCYDFVHLIEGRNKLKEREENGEVLHRSGILDYENNEHNKVIFSANDKSNSPIKLFHAFERGNGNDLTNRVYVDRMGFLSPYSDTPFIGCIDPYSSLDQTKSGDGSRAGIVIGSLLDAGLPNGGNTVHLTYNHRPATTDILLADVKKLMIYTGALFYIENNRGSLVQDLIKQGFGRFLLTYEKGEFRRWKYGEHSAGGFTGGNVIETYVAATTNYLKYPEPVKNGQKGIDYCYTILDDELFEQLLKFNPRDTSPYDLAVSFSLWTMVIRNYRRVIETRQNDTGEDEFILAFYGRKKNESSKYGTIKT